MSGASDCAGKVAFASWDAAARAQSFAKGDRKARWAYRCRFCQAWHLGSRVGKPRDVRRQRVDEIEAE